MDKRRLKEESIARHARMAASPPCWLCLPGEHSVNYCPRKTTGTSPHAQVRAARSQSSINEALRRSAISN
jgi:hypothetical protein